jgi:hypothetical protein
MEREKGKPRERIFGITCTIFTLVAAAAVMAL